MSALEFTAATANLAGAKNGDYSISPKLAGEKPISAKQAERSKAAESPHTASCNKTDMLYPLAIAKHQSIRKAAVELGLTPGAISQALHRLERRLATPLFHRTTRRISLTEAGQALLAKIGPAAGLIETSLEETLQSTSEPSGTLRLIVERLALPHVIEPILPAFREAWPLVKVDVMVSKQHDDFISRGYDAGILIGSYIAQDMVAIRISPPFKWAVFGSPAYFTKFGRPASPQDLTDLLCVRFRRPEKGDIYRWEFVEKDQTVRIEPNGPITVNDGELMRKIAVQGLGLIYSSTFHT